LSSGPTSEIMGVVRVLAHRGRGWRRSVICLAPLASTLTLLAPLAIPALAEAARPGALDRSFGGDGEVKAPVRYSYVTSVAIDSRQRIVASGGSFTLVRHKPNGRLDRSFGAGGVATTEFPREEGHVAWYASSVAMDSRRRIVVAGSKCYYEDSDHYDLIRCEIALGRYQPNGTQDGSFGVGGLVTTEIGSSSFGTSVAVDNHDRIVVAGSGGGDFALARYEPNGNLDPSFGAGGEVTTHFGSDSFANSVAIDSQGRIVAAGTSDSYRRFALARYNPDGSLDASFGAGGQVRTDFHRAAFASSVAVRPGGRIVVAGGSNGRFALARYRSNGGLDRSFSRNGMVTTRFGDRPGDRATAQSVAIDSRRRIVAAGGGFKLARYNRDGRLDRSFGRRGKVTTSIGHGYALALSAAIDAHDRIVVGGGHTNFVLARFIGYRRG
jgi:uncharacterized delta-60 repeat protein